MESTIAVLAPHVDAGKEKGEVSFYIENADGLGNANYLDIFVTPESARRRGC